MGKILSVSGQFYILKRDYPMLKLKFTRDINFEWIKLVLRVGLPILSFGILNGFAFLLQQRFVNMLGIIVAAALSIGFIIIQIVDGALFGLCGATAIMIGQNLGAENPGRAREIAFKTTATVFLLIAAGASIVYPLRQPIASIFTSDPKYLMKQTGSCR